MSARRHKPKGRKRPKRWHRGASEAARWLAVDLPDLGTDADPTSGQPIPLRRGHRRRGDAL